MATVMNILFLCMLATLSKAVNSANTNVDVKFEDDKKDNSPFDKILLINQKAAKVRSGAPQPKLFEGDIVETDVVRKVKSESRNKRGAINNPASLWPIVNGFHEVPYVIGTNGYFQAIYAAMREWMTKVPCIKFVQRSSQRDFLYFYSGSGCSSAVGRQGGSQYVSLANGCMQHGIIIHEIGHAMGFWHEQSRPDRDRYVTIYWNNIDPNMRFNFNIMNGINSRGVPYDYSSIMHYGPRAFAINSQYYTIVAKSGQAIGQRQGLSIYDVQQAKLMYCPGVVPTVPSAGCPRDLNTTCQSWAQSAYCTHTQYRSYMMINCKTSCCKNKDPKCQQYINNYGQQECGRNPAYMLYKCGESCNKCNC